MISDLWSRGLTGNMLTLVRRNGSPSYRSAKGTFAQMNVNDITLRIGTTMLERCVDVVSEAVTLSVTLCDACMYSTEQCSYLLSLHLLA